MISDFKAAIRSIIDRTQWDICHGKNKELALLSAEFQIQGVIISAIWADHDCLWRQIDDYGEKKLQDLRRKV